MTETKAYVLAMSLGVLVETAIFFGLEALGARGETVASAIVVWLVVMSFGVSLVGVHYERKGLRQRRHTDRR